MSPPVAILTSLALLCAPTVGAAQVPQALREAMQARLTAIWQKDTAAWSRLTGDEFTVVVPEGRLQTKPDRVAALAAEPRQAQHAVQAEQIRMYDGVAVRRFIDGDEWVLEVWVRQKGIWRVVAAQVNLVKE
jgi:hypothetical protein